MVGGTCVLCAASALSRRVYFDRSLCVCVCMNCECLKSNNVNGRNKHSTAQHIKVAEKSQLMMVCALDIEFEISLGTIPMSAK